MSVIHICRHCRKAVGTVGPFEDIITCGDYFLCLPCHRKEKEWDVFFEAVFNFKVPLGNDGNK